MTGQSHLRVAIIIIRTNGKSHKLQKGSTQLNFRGKILRTDWPERQWSSADKAQSSLNWW